MRAHVCVPRVLVCVRACACFFRSHRLMYSSLRQRVSPAYVAVMRACGKVGQSLWLGPGSLGMSSLPLALCRLSSILRFSCCFLSFFLFLSCLFACFLAFFLAVFLFFFLSFLLSVFLSFFLPFFLSFFLPSFLPSFFPYFVLLFLPFFSFSLCHWLFPSKLLAFGFVSGNSVRMSQLLCSLAGRRS